MRIETQLTVSSSAVLDRSGMGECQTLLALSSKQVQQHAGSSLSAQLSSSLRSPENFAATEVRTAMFASGRLVRLSSVSVEGRLFRTGKMIRPTVRMVSPIKEM